MLRVQWRQDAWVEPHSGAAFRGSWQPAVANVPGRSQAFGALSPPTKTTKTKKDKQVRHAGTFFPAHNSRIVVSRTKAIQGPQSKTRRECRCFLIVPTFRGSIFSPFLLFCPFLITTSYHCFFPLCF